MLKGPASLTVNDILTTGTEAGTTARRTSLSTEAGPARYGISGLRGVEKEAIIGTGTATAIIEEHETTHGIVQPTEEEQTTLRMATYPRLITCYALLSLLSAPHIMVVRISSATSSSFPYQKVVMEQAHLPEVLSRQLERSVGVCRSLRP